MIRIRISTILICLLAVSSCDFKEMMNKAHKIQEVTQANCGCDQTTIVSYNVENFRTTAHIQIVGADEPKREVANKINDALKKEIKDYCKIDLLQLDFINKGNHEIITIRYCKLDE